MRLFIYKFLTQTIIILGRIRDRLNLSSVILRSRTFKNPPDMFFSISCCDCGLIHFRIAEGGLEQPIRPTEYDYSWRRFAETPSTFKHDSEWIRSSNRKAIE